MNLQSKIAKTQGAKLSLQQVRQARKLVKAGKTQVEVARKFGVSAATICYLINGKKYREVV